MRGKDDIAEVCFWQNIPSPHMTPLARACCSKFDKVRYIYDSKTSFERLSSGWSLDIHDSAHYEFIHYANNKSFVTLDSTRTVNIFPGFRGAGLISSALYDAYKLGSNVGVALEAVDLRRNRIAKELFYRFLIRKARAGTDFALAISRAAKNFLLKHGFPEWKIFDFTYFIDEKKFHTLRRDAPVSNPKVVGFVGRLVSLKRLDLLIEAIGRIKLPKIRLVVVGDGPMAHTWKDLAAKLLPPDSVEWLGVVNQNEMPSVINSFDCLVLPSEYDGWGAVVTEGLLCGIPVICSDACGACTASELSKYSRVFSTRNAQSLTTALEAVLSVPLTEETRDEIRTNSMYLGASAGASYLRAIIDHVYADGPRPSLYSTLN